MKGFVFYVYVAVLVLAASCGDSDGPQSQSSQDSTIVAYLDSQNVDYSRDDNGIYAYAITTNDTGKTQAEGRVLSIYYEMSVLDGPNLISYDSTDGDLIKLKQGAGAIYPEGADIALSKMREGETWGFVIPSEKAFGMYSSSLIPANSIILFQATLQKVQSESDIQFEENLLIQEYVDSLNLEDTVANPLDPPVYMSNGMVYKRQQAGSGSQRPSSGDTVSINYTLYYPYQQSQPVDVTYAGSANPFVYEHGSGSIVAGLEAGVSRMQVGERALLIMPSAQGYKESAVVLPGYLTSDMVEMSVVPSYASQISPYEVLIFEVNLVQIN